MKYRHFLLPALLAAALHASDAPAPAADPSADADYDAVKTLLNTEDVPMAELIKFSQEKKFRYFDELNKKLSSAAIAFYEKHPTDSRRWEMVTQATAMAPLFIKSIGPDVETKGMSALVVDEEARVVWMAKRSRILEAMRTAKDVPVSVRAAVEWQELNQGLIQEGRSAKAERRPLNYEPTQVRFEAFLARYPDSLDLPGRVQEHLGILANYDPAAAQAGWENIAKSGNKALRDKAKSLLTLNERMSKPLEMAFTAVDGRAVDLAQLRGKVVLIDFWATWCGPCVAELPNVKKVYAAYHDQGFEVVGISLENASLSSDDQPEQAVKKLAKAKKTLIDFTAKHQMPWPQYFDGKAWANEISTQYNITGIPSMFLLDQTGKVVSTNARGEKLEAEVKRLLKL